MTKEEIKPRDKNRDEAPLPEQKCITTLNATITISIMIIKVLNLNGLDDWVGSETNMFL